MGPFIEVSGARSHNLRNITVRFPRGALSVITGVSGSGKSTLAFDTLFAEGQRRYVESLSTYARQFLERMSRPDVDSITGLPPAIAIEQKNSVKNARSTVGTATEINDYLRLLYAKVGVTVCPDCEEPVARDTVRSATDEILGDYAGERIEIVSPVPLRPAPRLQGLLREFLREGYHRVRLPDGIREIEEVGRPALRRLGVIPLLIDRLEVNRKESRRIAEALQSAYAKSGGLASLFHAGSEKRAFRGSFSCRRCGREFSEPVPLLFSFNNPLGACKTCQGFGRVVEIDLEKVIPDSKKSLAGDAVVIFTTPAGREMYRDLRAACRRYRVPMDRPYERLTAEQRDIIVKGRGEWYGILGFFEWLETKRYKVQARVFLARYRKYVPCRCCGGARLVPEALAVRLGGRNIADLSRMSIEGLAAFFEELELPAGAGEAAGRLLQETRGRLRYLLDVGLDYLTLNRATRTLSGGEAQRINLAAALGSSLTDTLYVLDEPSVGLHPRDHHRLLKVLKAIRDNGNTVIVVEHEPEIIWEADRIVDLGPGAGRNGGRVVYEGEVGGLAAARGSLTGRLLGKGPVPLRRSVRGKPKGLIRIRGATKNNLRGLNVDIPLGQLVCVTGVSGAGKSTLVNNILYAGFKGTADPKVDRGVFRSIAGFGQVTDMVLVDQAPIGRSARSNPVTYMKAFDEIRKLFASSAQARGLGYQPGDFSFNVAGGRCETCEGAGVVTLDMQFLEDVTVTCDGCNGRRFKQELLEVLYREKSIGDVLDMTVDEGIDFFYDRKKIIGRLSLLAEVGLGYITLGQPSSTLSGGEAQRIKLAFHMLEKRRSRILFLFDEPTTGLHMVEIEKLLRAFDGLLKRGHSVVVVEHNLDLVSCADTIIDLGPEGGERGGRLVVAGSPEEVMREPLSHTGRFLQARLGRGR